MRGRREDTFELNSPKFTVNETFLITRSRYGKQESDAKPKLVVKPTRPRGPSLSLLPTRWRVTVSRSDQSEAV